MSDPIQAVCPKCGAEIQNKACVVCSENASEQLMAVIKLQAENAKLRARVEELEEANEDRRYDAMERDERADL